jgi:mRNA-degrading endonuclease YafQ of YafQ-DinJ toxin-antitoxin module
VSQAIVENLEDVVSLQAKLKQQERELEKTRTALDAEKSSRDEAIAEKNEAIAQKQELSRQIKDLERTAEVVSRLSDVLSDERPIPKPYRITSLSARYEGQEPAHIGQDLAGTYYYGTYRTQGSNEFIQFLRMLNENNPVLAGILERAGGAEAAMSGSEAFRSAWISIASDPGLTETEYAFVKKTVYDPVVRFLDRSRNESGMGMNVDTHSPTLRAVIWSTAVQHGVANAKRLIQAALAETAPQELSDEAIIRRIYNERKNTRTWFPEANALLARLLRVRYDLELRDALKMLAEERQQ